MQTEVPVLPVVCSDGQKRSNRKINGEAGSSAKESKNHTQCKSAQFLISSRKHLNPILGAPYKNSMRLHCVSEPMKGTGKNPVGQRIISAKTLRVKELQNQLTDAHYHLNELANENRLLKALQKRQDSALKRYEGTNAELPRIINSHHEELKVLQTKYKRLKAQHRQTCDALKEKENEIHSLQTQNKRLSKLNRDKHLLEREKLQMQVSDLNHRIEQQQETIQTLNRKLTLESKSLKHQLHGEVTKHKDTQKQLAEATEKLKNLEELLDNREKRLYHSGQLPAFNKHKALTSQSLTNLGLSHLIKSSSKIKDSQNDFKNKSLPKLPTTDSSESKPSSSKTEERESLPKTETMTSLQKIRKFRLRKPLNQDSSSRPLTDRIKIDNGSEKIEACRDSMLNNSLPSDMHKLFDNSDTNELADEEIKNIVEEFERKMKNQKYNMPKDLRKEYGYSSDSESENNDENDGALPTSKSRDLHSKLINGVIDNKSLQVDRAQDNLIAALKHESIENKLSYKRLHISEIRDIGLLSTSTSESEVHKNEEEEEEDVVKVEKSEELNSEDNSKHDIENNQERLMRITKSWTELQERIKRERELSEHQLSSLNGDLPDTQDRKEDDNLLNYFEKNEREVEHEIFDSHVKSRRGTFEINHDNSHDNDSDLLTNGESTSIESEILDINRRKSSDGVVEANISNSMDIKNFKLPGNKKYNDSNDKIKIIECENEKINYNKEKLLAAMKAIDDNENIEFLPSQKANQRSNNSSIRSQVTENLYRGLPTHVKKRDDIIKDIFSDTKVDNKLRSGCSKLH